MSVFYPNIKRLYDAGRLTMEGLRKSVEIKYITEEEFERICGEPYNVEPVEESGEPSDATTS